MYRWWKHNSDESKTGDILAMATYPTYNLNDPYSAYTEDLEGIWPNLEQGEKTKRIASCVEE